MCTCNCSQGFLFPHPVPRTQGWACAHLLGLFHGHGALVLGCVKKADVRILAHWEDEGDKVV